MVVKKKKMNELQPQALTEMNLTKYWVWKRKVTEEQIYSIQNNTVYIKPKNPQNQITSCSWIHTCVVKLYWKKNGVINPKN